MADRTIRVTVVGDSRSLKAALKGSEASLKSLDATAAKSQQSLAKLDAGLANAGKWAALAAGASALTAAFLKVVDAASQLQSATAANERVFGAETTRMQEAAKAAQDYGLSQSQYLQTSAKLGAQLQNLGMSQESAASSAQSLMRMGENLAAVFGTDVPQAVTAISAALRGEFDPLEQYGVKLTAAKVAAEQSSKGISQAQAVMNLAMEQSKFSVGAAASAMDTYAGKQRAFAASWDNAQAAIGEGFLPAASAAVDALSSMASIVTKLPTGMREFLGTALAAAVAVKALQVGLGMAAAKTALLSTAMAKSNGSAVIAAGGMSRVSNALTKLGTALPVIGATFVIFAETMAWLDDRIAEGATTMEDFTSSLANTGDLSAAQFNDVAGSIARVSEGTSAWATALSVAGLGAGVLIDKWLNADFKTAQLEIDNLNKSLSELMAVNPQAGIVAVQAAFDGLIAKGIPASVAMQHLSGSMITANQAIATWMGSTTVAASNLQGLVAAFDEATAAAQRTAHALDAVFAGLDVDVAVADWKAALKGIGDAAAVQDPHVIQSLNQQWRSVTDAMQANGATVQQVAAKWGAMRGQMRSALAGVGIEGERATGILNKIFGKRWQVVAAFKGDTTDVKNKATVAQKMLDAINQRNPARIFAKWLGQGDTNRADRDIDGVRQDNPATITADGSQAIDEALRVQSELSAASGVYTAVLNVFLNLGEGVQAWMDRLWGAGDWYDWQFGDDDADIFGQQTRDTAMNTIERLFGRSRHAKRAVEQVVVVRLKTEGDFTVTIKNLQKLQDLATETNKKGNLTAAAKQARAELRVRRQLADAANEFMRNVTTAYQGEERAYGWLRRKLDQLREARTQLAREMAEAINAVDIGGAWDQAQSQVDALKSKLGELTDEEDALRKARAETWNPRLIDYYNQKLLENAAKQRYVESLQGRSGVADQLQAQLDRTRKFYDKINELRRKGLSNSALQELVRTGADQGAAIADALAGNDALREKYNDVFKEAEKMSRSLGETIADDAYAARIKEIEGAIRRLKREVEKWLKAHKQIKWTINWVDVGPKNATRSYAAPTLADRTGRQRASEAQRIDLHVHGNLVDPEGAARAIKKLLRDSANRNGKVAWAGAA